AKIELVGKSPSAASDLADPVLIEQRVKGERRTAPDASLLRQSGLLDDQALARVRVRRCEQGSSDGADVEFAGLGEIAADHDDGGIEQAHDVGEGIADRLADLSQEALDLAVVGSSDDVGARPDPCA